MPSVATVIAVLGLLLNHTAAFPTFTLSNWDGRVIDNESLESKTTIIVPTYAKCIFACPMVTLFLTELDKELGAPEDIQYLLVSVNPADDTAEEVRLHFEKHDIDAEADPRWLFANGSEDGLRKFHADTGVEVSLEKVQEGVLIQHTIRVFVVGPDGETLADFDTYFWDREEMLHALRYATHSE